MLTSAISFVKKKNRSQTKRASSRDIPKTRLFLYKHIYFYKEHKALEGQKLKPCQEHRGLNREIIR